NAVACGSPLNGWKYSLTGHDHWSLACTAKPNAAAVSTSELPRSQSVSFTTGSRPGTACPLPRSLRFVPVALRVSTNVPSSYQTTPGGAACLPQGEGPRCAFHS